jgi:hypothetical protein
MIMLLEELKVTAWSKLFNLELQIRNPHLMNG